MQDRTDPVAKRQSRLARRARLVGWAKVLLPVAALLVIGAIFLAGRERGDVTDLFTAEELARLGAGLRLDNPRLAGVTDEDQPYQITAVAALPDGPMATRISFEAPSGHIDMPDRRVSASAEEGLLDRDAERLTLAGGVTVETSDGWRAALPGLEIDLAGRTAEGTGAFEATGPNGTLAAGSFRVMPGGEAAAQPTIWFENGVRVLFIPPSD